MNNFPISRHDPGELPEPPEHFNANASQWFWKIAAWSKVRNNHVRMTVSRLEDVATLLDRYEESEDEKDKEVALMNINILLAEVGFCNVDLVHLEIPEHEIFTDHRRVVEENKMKVKPEH